MMLCEAASVDSDCISTPMEACDRQGSSQSMRRGRKQSKPIRSAFSSDTPSDSHHPADLAAVKTLQHQSFLAHCSNGGAAVGDDSPVLNNHAGTEQPLQLHLQELPAAAAAAASSKLQQHSTNSSGSGRAGKNAPVQRQGPCGHCKTPYSPQWRKGPRNKPVLCNACGIRYLRNRHLGRTVPQKKRTTVASVKHHQAAATSTDTAGETSMDTMSDTAADMQGVYKKRRTKQLQEVASGDTSDYSYSYDGSVGSLHSLMQHQQQAYSDTDPAIAVSRGPPSASVMNDDIAAGPAPDNGDRAGVAAAAAGSGSALFSTSLPGNMQPVLASLGSSLAGNSSSTSSAAFLGGTYSMAPALQLYQQQQQQLLLNQQLLMAQSAGGAGGSGSAALQASTTTATPSTGEAPAAAALQQGEGSHATSVSAPSTSTAAAAAAGYAPISAHSLLLSQSLTGLLLQSQQQQQQQLLQAAGMLHGPSPLSLMTSANIASSLSSLLQAPSVSAATTTAATGGAPHLEIAPLVTGDKPHSLELTQSVPATATAALVAPAEPAISVPAAATAPPAYT